MTDHSKDRVFWLQQHFLVNLHYIYIYIYIYTERERERERENRITDR